MCITRSANAGEICSRDRGITVDDAVKFSRGMGDISQPEKFWYPVISKFRRSGGPGWIKVWFFIWRKGSALQKSTNRTSRSPRSKEQIYRASITRDSLHLRARGQSDQLRFISIAFFQICVCVRVLHFSYFSGIENKLTESADSHTHVFQKHPPLPALGGMSVIPFGFSRNFSISYLGGSFDSRHSFECFFQNLGLPKFILAPRAKPGAHPGPWGRF